MNPDEQLLRWIKSIPELWKWKYNRPSSAVFKQSNGVSVDQLLNRDIAEGVDTLIQRMEEAGGETLAVVSLSVQQCLHCSTHPIPVPIEDNVFHAEIRRNDQIIELTVGQARCLSRNCEIEYFSQGQEIEV